MNNLYTGIIIGATISSAIVFCIMWFRQKFKDINKNLEMLVEITESLQSNISTPEEMAKEVLKVKLPLSDIPPEAIAEVKKRLDALGIKPDSKFKNQKQQYIG